MAEADADIDADASETTVIGKLGFLSIATRGPAGPGEITIRIRGGTESYIAWSAEPMVTGASALVIEDKGNHTVWLEPWYGPDLNTSTT